MKIKEIMNKNIPTIYDDDSIENAIKLLISIPQSSLPVINKRRNVIGELSQRKLLLIDIGEDEYNYDNIGFKEVKFLFAKKARKVKELMDKIEFTMMPDDDVINAAKILYEKSISTIPIVDKKNKLLGILTDICILKHYKKIMRKK